jgi:hypothetical protein
MAEQPKSIDISDVPDILRLAEEVRRAGDPGFCAGMEKTRHGCTDATSQKDSPQETNC